MTDATLTAATEAFSMTTTGGTVVCFHSDGPEQYASERTQFGGVGVGHGIRVHCAQAAKSQILSCSQPIGGASGHCPRRRDNDCQRVPAQLRVDTVERSVFVEHSTINGVVVS